MSLLLLLVLQFFFPLLLFSDVLFPPLEPDFSEVTSWRIFFKMSPEGKKLLNIIVLGFGFMFMFTAFQTCGNIEVCAAIHNPGQSTRLRIRHASRPTKSSSVFICAANGHQELQQHRVPRQRIHKVSPTHGMVWFLSGALCSLRAHGVASLMQTRGPVCTSFNQICWTQKSLKGN